MSDIIIIDNKKYKVITVYRYNKYGICEPYDIYEEIK